MRGRGAKWEDETKAKSVTHTRRPKVDGAGRQRRRIGYGGEVVLVKFWGKQGEHDVGHDAGMNKVKTIKAEDHRSDGEQPTKGGGRKRERRR